MSENATYSQGTLQSACDDHPPMQAIIRAFRAAGVLAVQHVRDAAVSIGGKDPAEMRSLLQKCAATSLNSKLVRTLGSAANLLHSRL